MSAPVSTQSGVLMSGADFNRPSRPGVLVLSASAGTGHVRAGAALAEALRELDPALAVDHVDVLDLAPGWVRAAYAGSFELLVKRTPRLWRALYRKTDGPAPDASRWPSLAARALFRGFRDLLSREDWRSCLCTHFLPCQLVRAHRFSAPMEIAVTDFTAHRFWVQRGASRYFVAGQELARDLEQRLPGVEVNVTGIPVAPSFSRAPARAEARRSLELDPGPVALVMGGGMGVGVEEAVRMALRARVSGLQVVGVCGNNSAAQKRLSSLGVSREKLRILGYVTGVERWMAAADVVVSKPGGLTSSEALAVGRPLLLLPPIPGHEEGNLRVLMETGAALHAPRTSSVASELERLFGEPSLLPRLSEAARKSGRPDAAREIARAVLERAMRGVRPPVMTGVS
jgi:processive 1,2-diacylglycerol beta-glucosyltransferase